MSGIRKRSPTNKEFKTNFQGLASTKTKKGHLTSQERESDDVAREYGTLIRIHKNKMYENGWEVQVGTDKDAVTYMCSYQSSVLYIPDSTETDSYYVPKQKTQVEVNIDKKSKIYTIVKINSLNKTPIALYENNLTISTNTNEDTNKDVKASIEVSNESITLKSNNIVIKDSDNNKINLVESNKNLSNLQQEVSDLKDEKEKITVEISTVKESIQSNTTQNQEIKTDISNKVDSTVYNNFIDNDYTPLKESVSVVSNTVSNVYTKSQIDNLFSTQDLLFRSSLMDFYSKEEIDNLIENIDNNGSGNQNINLDDYVKRTDLDIDLSLESNGYLKIILDVGG